MLWACAAACDHAARTAPRPRGPIARLAVTRPATLAACATVDRQYGTPFWRGPYRECRDSSGTKFEFMELDADTVLTQLSTVWDVPASSREAEFRAAAVELTSLFGPSVACAPTMLVWRGREGAHAALLMRPNTDVIGPGTLDSVSWRISRHARLGPLGDAFWCRRARDSLGA